MADIVLYNKKCPQGTLSAQHVATLAGLEACSASRAPGGKNRKAGPGQARTDFDCLSGRSVSGNQRVEPSNDDVAGAIHGNTRPWPL